ncbi:E2F-associated phosphoprotein [Eublepharis macularius]|uniref:E2F-associated phosphoprotein n=1 Tax=Eublepharis macularius TaxID=481883 RepID=A0AA97IUT5_EUBMA|nr:E2F-associated phosphoprotein [Eublepharis macularius]XP_054825990.1 E2F-associated phosphoprotein [Eublepharis macularius]
MSRLREEEDPYVIEEPSDEEPAQSSSEDEVDVLLHGTPEQKRKLIRECLTGESESSSEDEFQKEMEAELDCTMKNIEGKWKLQLTGAASTAGQSGTVTTSKYYDDIYFDSDSEEEDKVVSQEVKKKRKHKQRRIPTNDELLYDPEEDKRDQEWVDRQRRRYHNIRSAQTEGKQAKLPVIPSSDAVLNCPACMTTLCLDCQRHETYRTQYRAMFVMNCTVIKEEILKYKGPLNKKTKRVHKKIKQSIESVAGLEKQEEEEEIYHPVKCTECSTEVAVLDKDEVFHFFNVLASHC